TPGQGLLIPGRRRGFVPPVFVLEMNGDICTVARGRRNYMFEQRENSVLFSLKELRRIEDDRIRQEEADVQARVEAERHAREEAERRAREEVERRARDEADRVRKIEDDKLAHERE